MVWRQARPYEPVAVCVLITLLMDTLIDTILQPKPAMSPSQSKATPHWERDYSFNGCMHQFIYWVIPFLNLAFFNRVVMLM